MGKKIKRPLPKFQKVPDKPVRVIPPKTAVRINYYWVALGVVILCISLIRFRLVNIPLERDEGEYAYIGKLMLDGTPPYTEAYNMKLPGTYGMYALIMEFFGKTTSGIHYGLLFLNIATIIFLFLAFKKLFNSPVALYAACVYGIMAVSPTVLGFAAHATHFVSFFVAVALFFLSRFYERRKLLFAFLAGIMFGLSLLMKQQAVFFILFGGIAIILAGALEKPFRFKPLLLQASVYSAGTVIPYVITILILKVTGALEKFWFWTVTYASKYATGTTLKIGLQDLGGTFKPMWQEFTFFWILFFMGIILTFLTKFSLKQKLTAILFTLVAFLTVCPGFYFRPHYFISFLPAVGLLGAFTLHYLSSLITRYLKIRSLAFLPFLVFCIVSIAAVLKNKDFYLRSDPNDICKTVYGDNPFIESVEIANYIKENSVKTDKIAVLGSEPQIFFYADRHSATGYVYVYSLMEVHDYNMKMQEEMIAEIEKSKPKILVYSLVSASWLRKPGSPDNIFNWIANYISQNYELTGVTDIGADQTIYKWNEEARKYQHKSTQYILIYKRI